MSEFWQGTVTFLVVMAVPVVAALLMTRDTRSERKVQKHISKELERRREAAKVEESTNPNTPKCLCGHWYVVHHDDDDNAACAHKGCQCMRYMGPDPLASGLWMRTRGLKANDQGRAEAAEGIKQQIARINEISGFVRLIEHAIVTEDFERARTMEYNMYTALLEEIADGSTMSADLAKAALVARELAFPR